MTGNDFMTFVLRSPFHRLLSKGMMVITITGRKTGRKISLPVDYYREENTLWVITTRRRTWWKNLRSAAPVTLRLQGRDVNATAQAVEDEDAVHTQLMDYLKHLPDNARGLNIRTEAGAGFSVEDLARTVKERLFVKFQLL